MLRFAERPREEGGFARPEGMSPILHALLERRGITSAEEAERFLHPSEADLHDPMLLSDMPEAVERIRLAAARNERVCVWGDYDCDGVSASSVMRLALLDAGVDAEIYIPSRHEEGYGLNDEGIRAIAERADLLITVDCGISNGPQVALAKELGLDCIVTDHHRPGDLMPECLTINPLLNDYPFPWLCGAGVAFKLAEALNGRDAAMQLIDIAAIATVADIVSLTGENRVIVAFGLRRINTHPRPGIASVIRSAGIEAGNISSEDIGFRIAPRINAAGRMGDARRAYELLTADNDFDADMIADELNRENTQRQELERIIQCDVEEPLQSFDFSAHRILMLRGKGWNRGVIGLAAGKLCSRLHFPVIVFSEEDGLLTGSGRSIPGVDIFEAFSAAAHLMVKFGGHAQAGGLTIHSEDFDELQRLLDAHIAQTASPEAFIPCEEYDLPIRLQEVTPALVKELELLEPTGHANERPVFRSTVKVVDKRRVGTEGRVLSMTVSDEGTRMKTVMFGAGERADTIGDTIDILHRPGFNTFNGNTTVQLQLAELRNTDILSRLTAAKQEISRLQRRFLTELFYNKGIEFSARTRSIVMDNLRELLAQTVQGTLILCADTETADMLFRRSFAPLELCVGTQMPDVRLFNTVWLCPDAPNCFPASLRTLVLCGCPAPKGIPDHVEILTFAAPFALSAHIPDVNAMREVYRQALLLTRRGAKPVNYEALLDSLSAACGQHMLSVHMSLLALADMKLIRMADRPFRMEVPPAEKTDPETSEVWRRLQKLRIDESV